MTTSRTANYALATATPGKALNIVLWTLQVLVALAFVAAGSGKVVGRSWQVSSARSCRNSVEPLHRLEWPTGVEQRLFD